jgi:hypothetical protein
MALGVNVDDVRPRCASTWRRRCGVPAQRLCGVGNFVLRLVWQRLILRPPRRLMLGSVVAVAAQLWSETAEVPDSLRTPRLLLVCSRWCLHQFGEVMLRSRTSVQARDRNPYTPARGRRIRARSTARQCLWCRSFRPEIARPHPPAAAFTSSFVTEVCHVRARRVPRTGNEHPRDARAGRQVRTTFDTDAHTRGVHHHQIWCVLSGLPPAIR